MNATPGPLLIRDLLPWEGAKVFAMTGDPEVTRYMGFRTHTDVDQAAALIERYRTSPSRWQALCDESDPSDILGIVGVEVQGHQATVTLMFRRDWKARGRGRQFSRTLVDWLLSKPQIWRVWSYVHVDNKGGQHATERTGAACEGRLRRFEYFPNISDEPQDVYVYSIVRD